MAITPSTANASQIHSLIRQYLYLVPLFAILSYVIYQRTLSPLSRVPGPFFASLTHWYLVALQRSGKFHQYIVQLHEQYGSVVRIAPDEISVVDPKGVKKIFGVGSHFRKSEWYSVFQGPRKFDLFAGRDERLHGQQRKHVARAYAMETLKDLEIYVDNILTVLVRKIDECAGQSIDIASWVQLFAFDVIGEVTWSTSFGFTEASHDDGTFATILDVSSSGAWLGHVPYVYRIHERLKPFIGNWLGVNGRHGGIRNFALRETAARKDRPVEKKDIVGRLFEKHDEKPDEFSYTDLVSMATSNVNAGSDTTAISMRAMIYYLLKNPEAKRKLVDEIDDFRRRGELSNPARYDEAMKMGYLQAVIQEGLRLHPAVGTMLPRVVPLGGVEIGGHDVPEGMVVGANAWAVHRNKAIYGEDADEFRPERWSNDTTGDMHKCFLSFGGGSRACIGRNVSWLEMSKLLPTLFLKYDIELAKPEQDWTTVCAFFVLQKDFDVTMTPREDPVLSA